MKSISDSYHLLTDGNFSGYFGLNRKRSRIQNGFNGIFNLYISNSFNFKDLAISIENMKYMEYESPTDKTFKKFNK